MTPVEKIFLMYQKTISFFSISLATLVLLTGLAGIMRPAMYETEAFNWQIQTVWQDYVDVIFVVPVLLVSGFFSSRGSLNALSVWAGTLLYLCYTYAIFAFSIHFNRSFLFYCIILGLSFYGILWFFHKNKSKRIMFRGRSWWLAIYLILTGAVFYLAWLADVSPALLLGSRPAGIEQAGLFTNPVHVLDLSIVLPAYIICGILLLGRQEIGVAMAPVLLSFGALMGLSTSTLQLVLFFNHMAHSLPVAFFLLLIAVVNIFFLIHLRNNHLTVHKF